MANQRQLFLFDRIPAELLLMVKEEIPRYDLRTHVCFCRSHQRVGALYGSDDEQEQFWHRACWLAGLGLLPGENPEEVSWRNIAFECVERDGFWSDQPELSVCGGDLLMENAQNMRSAIDQAGYPVEELSAHPALDYIPEQIHTYDFRRSKVELVGNWHLSYDVPCIVSNYVDRDGTKLCSVLRTHPVVARSFATFPPVQRMSFEDFIGVELPDLFNPSGITVQDVADTLHAKLEEGLTVAAVAAFLASELYSETCEMPNWCITEAFLRFTTLRGIFSVFAVQKVIVREDMEGHRLFYIWIEVRKDDFADTDIDGDPITSMFHWRRPCYYIAH